MKIPTKKEIVDWENGLRDSRALWLLYNAGLFAVIVVAGLAIFAGLQGSYNCTLPIPH